MVSLVTTIVVVVYDVDVVGIGDGSDMGGIELLLVGMGEGSEIGGIELLLVEVVGIGEGNETDVLDVVDVVGLVKLL